MNRRGAGRGPSVARTVLLLAFMPGLAVSAPRTTVRHEYVPPDILAEAAAAVATPTALEPAGGPGDLPRALLRDGERLPAPAVDRPDSPTVDGPEVGGAPTAGAIMRPDKTRPDRSTQVDSDLSYHVLYNPEVAPLRRNVAFNEVGDPPEYDLSIRQGARRPVAILGGSPPAGREAFWGDLRVDLIPNVPAPVPSVAPDMHILAFRTEPPSDAVFERDAADNLYVVTSATGSLRLVFLADADRRYFSGPVPGNVRLDVGRDDPDTRIPPAAAAEARQVLARIGVSADMPFDRGLGRLVGYFRAFEAGDLVDGPGDLYLDLALGGHGVCRHRAFAFLVTARAAGVPTRYVQNEAHAFAEIKAPDGTWRRVDLGGQAPQLDVKGGEGGRLHTPPPDAFPKPESYEKSYSSQLLHGLGTGRDASGKPSPGALKPLGPGAKPGNGPKSEIPIPVAGDAGVSGVNLPGSGPGSGPGGPGGAGDGPDAGPLSSLPPAPGSGVGAGPGGGPGALRPTRLVLESSPGGEVYRGEDLPFEAAGRLTTDEGEPVPDVRVQVFLVPAGGPEAGPPLAVGEPIRTGADGRFRSRLRLPQTLPLGRYTLLAASETSKGFAPARSD